MKKINTALQTIVLTLMSASPAMAQAGSSITIPRPRTFLDVGIGNIISAVVGILLIVAAILAFLFLIIGGVQWITSGGDKSGMESARNKITAAIVGLIIVAAAWAVMLLVGAFIGFDILGGKFEIPTFLKPN